MRTQSIILLACLVLAIAVPSLANRPLPNVRALHVEDDDYLLITPALQLPAEVIASLPIAMPPQMWIPVPGQIEPVMDEDLYHLMVRPVTECCKKMAR